MTRLPRPTLVLANFAPPFALASSSRCPNRRPSRMEINPHRYAAQFTSSRIVENLEVASKINHLQMTNYSQWKLR